MNTRLKHIIEVMRNSLWLVPSICVLCAGLLSLLASWMDRNIETEVLAMFPGYVPRSPESVRTLLATLGSSMLGVAGVSFSITVVALSLASSQFGPRLLRNFIRDTRNQTVLGIQIGVFVYCLAQLSLLGDGLDKEFRAPVIGVAVALIAAVLGLMSFIYFIHHITSSMQAESVIRNVFDELCARIREYFPEKDEDETRRLDPQKWIGENVGDVEPTTVEASRSGYLQAIDNEELVTLAAKHECVAYCLHHPGVFLNMGDPVLHLYTDRKLDDSHYGQFSRTCLQGYSRSLEQDFEFAIHQLVEVAVRALSPGINDPFTAIVCIDYLGAAYSLIADRQMPGNVWEDGDENVRLIGQRVSFHQVFCAGINQIRQNSRHNLAVSIRLLDMLISLARRSECGEIRESIDVQFGAIRATLEAENYSGTDMESIEERVSKLEELL